MSKKGKKPGKDNDNPMVLSEAEKKALEKLDQSKLLNEISNYKNRIEELQDDVYQLNQQIRKNKEENLMLTLKMEKDINEKEDKIAELNIEFQDYRHKADEKQQQIIEERDKLVKIKTDELSHVINDKDRKVEELLQEINRMSHFNEREEQYKQQILDLEQTLKEKEYAHHDEMKKLEKNFYKQNQNLDSVHRAKILDVQKNADKVAEQKVKDKEESIKKENKKLKQELEVYMKELEQLKKEKSLILDENKNFKQSQSIYQDGTYEYQQVNHQQAVKIKKLKEKVDYLKNYISDEVAKYTKEMEFMKYQHSTKLQEQDQQIRSLKDQLASKSRELKNVKALAQMILDQRSDIEQFFLQALDQVKGEIKKKQSLEKKTKLPDISQKSNIEEQKSKFYSDKVDINDLDLEEKEKLLRILFSKMNQGIPASNWKQLEQSSFHDQHIQQ